MKKLTDRELVLSIETAVGGGSLSLLANSREIGGWGGTRGVSKAEDVLEQISELLRANRIEKKSVKLVCVSSGTGSSTGEKIGRALGKGLAKALDCSLLGISILESLLLEIEDEPDGEYMTALPRGRNFVCRQKFIKKDGNFHQISAVEVSETDDFFIVAESFRGNRIVVATSFEGNLRRLPSEASRNLFVATKTRLANLNGRVASRRVSNASDNELALREAELGGME